MDVFVHDVIAAINIEPSLISKSVPSTFEVFFFFLDVVSQTGYPSDRHTRRLILVIYITLASS